MMLFGRAFALIVFAFTLWAPLAQAKESTSKPTKKSTPSKPVDPAVPGADAGNNKYQVVTSNKFDFEAANIDGKMKAPMGFMLQGRKSHSQENMVELRSNFRNELMDSKSAVMAIPAPIP